MDFYYSCCSNSVYIVWGPWEYHEESIMFKTTLNKFGVLLDLRIHKAPVDKKACDESQYSSVAQQGTYPDGPADSLGRTGFNQKHTYKT